MAPLVPAHLVEVDDFSTDRAGLASDEEWDSEIEEEIVTFSLSRALDTSILSSPDFFAPSSPVQATTRLPESNHPNGAAAEGSGDEGDGGGQEEGRAAPARSARPPPPTAGPSRRGEGTATSGGKHTWQLVGLNTTTPYLKVNNQVFVGRTKELIGTDMIWRMRSSRDDHSPVPAPMIASPRVVSFTPLTYGVPAPAVASTSLAPSQRSKQRKSAGGGADLLDFTDEESEPVTPAVKSGRRTKMVRDPDWPLTGPGSRGGRGKRNAGAGRGRGRGRGRGSASVSTDGGRPVEDSDEDEDEDQRSRRTSQSEQGQNQAPEPEPEPDVEVDAEAERRMGGLVLGANVEEDDQKEEGDGERGFLPAGTQRMDWGNESDGG